MTTAPLFCNSNTYRAVSFLAGGWRNSNTDTVNQQPPDMRWAEVVLKANPVAAISSRISFLSTRYRQQDIAVRLNIPVTVVRKHRALTKAYDKRDADVAAIDAAWLKCCEDNYIVSPLQQLCDAAAV